MTPLPPLPQIVRVHVAAERFGASPQITFRYDRRTS
jgi:hypothetical protein